MGVPCGTKFLWEFIFADWAFFSVLRNQFLPLGVVKQECSVIVRWRDFVINSSPRLSDFTDCGVKHSKYSIKLTT